MNDAESGPEVDLKGHPSAVCGEFNWAEASEMPKERESQNYSQSTACLLIAGHLLSWKEVREAIHTSVSACRLLFWGKRSAFFSCFQMPKMRKATYQRGERGKPVNVTLVCDDQRYAPPLLCPENGSNCFPSERHLDQSWKCPFALHVATQTRGCLLPCLWRAGHLAFPSRNRAA